MNKLDYFAGNSQKNILIKSTKRTNKRCTDLIFVITVSKLKYHLFCDEENTLENKEMVLEKRPWWKELGSPL